MHAMRAVLVLQPQPGKQAVWPDAEIMQDVMATAPLMLIGTPGVGTYPWLPTTAAVFDPALAWTLTLVSVLTGSHEGGRFAVSHTYRNSFPMWTLSRGPDLLLKVTLGQNSTPRRC